MDKKFIKKVGNKFHEYKSHIVVAVIFIILIFIAYEYYHKYLSIIKSPIKIKHIIMSYGQYSILAFFVLQVIQVVAFFIPGEVIQIAGGYIYGTLWGSLLSILGITMGSMLVYSISSFYGKPLVNKIISKRDLKYFEKVLKAGSVNNVVFLLYLIPGIPKDVLAYICGISNITFKNFVIYSTLGRLPGIFMSAYFGAKINTRSQGILITVAMLAILLFVIGVFKGKEIISNIVEKKGAKSGE